MCWIEVLISRFELLDAIGRTEGVADTEGQVAHLHAKHLTALGTFRPLCCQYISENLAVPPPRHNASPVTPLQIAQRRVLEGERRIKHQQELIEWLEAMAVYAVACGAWLRLGFPTPHGPDSVAGDGRS